MFVHLCGIYKCYMYIYACHGVFVKEVKAFNTMLGRLLNAGCISQARELAALFDHDSPDLTIVLVRDTHTYMYMHSVY